MTIPMAHRRPRGLTTLLAIVALALALMGVQTIAAPQQAHALTYSYCAGQVNSGPGYYGCTRYMAYRYTAYGPCVNGGNNYRVYREYTNYRYYQATRTRTYSSYRTVYGACY